MRYGWLNKRIYFIKREMNKKNCNFSSVNLKNNIFNFLNTHSSDNYYRTGLQIASNFTLYR